MKSKQSYRIPIIISIFLHAIVFALLFLHYSPVKMQAESKVQVVKAVAINENQLQAIEAKATSPLNQETFVSKVAPLPQNTIRKIEQMALKQPEVPKTNIAKSLENSVPELEAPPTRAKTVMRDEKPVVLQEPKLENKRELERQEEKQRQAELKKKEKQQALKRREEEANQLQQELVSESKQVESEAKVNATDANEANAAKESLTSNKKKHEVNEKGLDEEIKEEQQLSEAQSIENQAGDIDKYKHLIVEAISRKWLIPDTQSQDLACQLLVHVGPGGVVLNVDVVKESGDEGLDRSARNAIMKASPLPVPEGSELFDNFRSLRLTFRPQGIVSG